MAAKTLQYLFTLLIGGSIVLFVIQPAVKAVGVSMEHSADCISNPTVANCG